MKSAGNQIAFFSLIAGLAVLGGWSARAAGLGSPFASTVQGLTIGNAHLLSQGAGMIFRGAAPEGKVDELIALGVNEVVIFKNETGAEVGKEIAALRDAGIPAGRIHHIPARWKQIPGFREACSQTIQAVKILDRAYRTTGAKLYFHCTMGEDRTGFLAGLFRVVEEGWSVDQAFQNEMCLNGYEAGNPNKPRAVVQPIRQELTPIYLKMAYLMRKAMAENQPIGEQLCTPQAEEIANQALVEYPQYDPSRYVCRPSSRARLAGKSKGI